MDTPQPSDRRCGLILPPVVRAAPAEAPDLARLIGHSFRYLDPSDALVPDMRFRVDVLSDYFQIIVEHAMTYGHVDVLADRSAVAVWLDYTKPVPEPDDYQQRRAAAGGQWADNLAHLDTVFEGHHPTFPHHYLPLLAVTEDEQGTGRGTKLLAHHHGVLDAAGIPSYLEAASWRLTGVYQARGYRSGEPFHMAGHGMPGHGPAFWPTLRDPQPTP